MAKTTEVILLERVDPHGKMGDVVNVKPGFARNYLLPQKKALRATASNLAYFETQKKELEAQNENKRKDAAKDAKKLEGLSLILIRQAGDKGHLYGSVSSRDIVEALAKQNIKIGRSAVNLNDAVKEIGLFEVEIILHPEVRQTIEINVARNEGEAEIQKKTGKAMIAGEGETPDEVIAKAERELESSMKADLLEEDALQAEQEQDAEKAVKEQQEAEKAAEKAAVKAEKKAKKAAAEAEESEDDSTVEDEKPSEDGA